MGGQLIGDWPRADVSLVDTGSHFGIEVEGERLGFAAANPSGFRSLTGGGLAARIERARGQSLESPTAQSPVVAPARTRRSVGPAWASVVILVGALGVASLAGEEPPPVTTVTTTTAEVRTTAPATSTIQAPVSTMLALPTKELVVVASITDGDTIRVLMPDGTNEPVRLIGIDASEPGQPFSAEASELLAALVAGRTIRMVPDQSDRDRFGRLLRYLYVGDDFVNALMVESGLAIAREYPPDTAMANILEDAQRSAQESGRGQWGLPATTTAPATTAPVTTAPTAVSTTAPPPTTTAPPVSTCHSSYLGACLAVGQGDYDCAGGSGNGPNYISGPIQVVGPDEFDLDRDGDGIGCEG